VFKVNPIPSIFTVPSNLKFKVADFHKLWQLHTGLKDIRRTIMVIYVIVSTSDLLRLIYVWTMFYLFGIKV